MKHSFKIKKHVLKTVFKQKLGFNSLSIENKNDVYNSINTILNFMALESFLRPAYCSYNFMSNHVSFQLELLPGHDKLTFFEAIRQFETFLDVEVEAT